MKRFLLCADVEGASGVGSESMLSGKAFQQVRELITGDVNACVRGIRGALPDAEIDLFDAHGLGGNILEEELEPGVQLLGGGWVDTLFPLVTSGKLDHYDGLFLLGQHAANGTRNGFLSHTNNGSTALRVNGLDVGEVEQITWLAGAYGVPTLLVVGDDATEREANALLPHIRTVVVKSAVDWRSAECKTVEDAQQEIEAASALAVESLADAVVSTIDEPVQMTVFFSHPEMAQTAKAFRDVNVDDAGAVRFESETYVDAWFLFQTVSRVCPPIHLSQVAYGRLRTLEGAEEIELELIKEISASKFAEESAIPDVRY